MDLVLAPYHLSCFNNSCLNYTRQRGKVEGGFPCGVFKEDTAAEGEKKSESAALIDGHVVPRIVAEIDLARTGNLLLGIEQELFPL